MRSPIAINRDGALILYIQTSSSAKDTVKGGDKKADSQLRRGATIPAIPKEIRKILAKHLEIPAFFAIFVADKRNVMQAGIKGHSSNSHTACSSIQQLQHSFVPPP